MSGGLPEHGLPLAGAQSGDRQPLAPGLSTEFKVGAGFFIAFVALAILGWTGFATVRAYKADTELVVHTRQVLETLADLDATVGRVGSAHRSFLLTADQQYLDHGRNAADRLTVLRAFLENLVQDNPRQLELLPTLDSRTQVWAGTLEDNRQLLAAEGPGSELMRTRMALLWSVLGDVQETLSTLRQHETELLAIRTLAAARRADQVAATFVGLLIAVGAAMFLLLPRIRSEIAERRQAQDHAVRVASQLRERSEALAAVNQELEAFSYSVSHDLRSPARAIDGFARIIEEEHASQLDAEGHRLLGVVRSNSQRMGKLIDDLLAFSRLGRKHLTRAPVDMRALAQRALDSASHGAQATKAAISIGPVAAAHGDSDMLLQVWTNLLDNAIKYTGRTAAPQVHVDSYDSAGEIVYRIRDNGAGFDMRFYDKLFGVFQRLHGASEFPGTGVGLAIVKRVVDRHGGRVWAEGAPDRGATFYFALPRGP